MHGEMSEELQQKLLEAQSVEEMTDLLRTGKAEYTAEEVSQIWQEIERCKADLDHAGKEEAVFSQDVSMEELESASGGRNKMRKKKLNNPKNHWDIYGDDHSFPNCAATVDDGSWCASNDACIMSQILYQGMVECKKAWK